MIGGEEKPIPTTEILVYYKNRQPRTQEVSHFVMEKF